MPRNSNQIKKHIVLRRSDRNLAPAQKSTTLVAKGVEKTFVLSALWRTSIPVANFVRRQTNSDIPRPKSREARGCLMYGSVSVNLPGSPWNWFA